MPKKRTEQPGAPRARGVIEGAGAVVEQKITDTLETNYMPYAMSVILSRAIPEIDGFKPSHRKLLFTMYKMGLLGSARTKSANIVGQTMKLNPHSDSAIYDTMVRLSRGYEALLHPYVDSKGNFGKFYSRDMAWAASRYTEARLDNICEELFRDIDKDTVDFVDNYDNTLKEPTLLPAAFPSVLVNANTGIAVGMASSICPFNLNEVCQTTIALMRDPEHEIASTLLAPDFPGGGQLIYDHGTMDEIYRTGRGSVRIRSRYSYDKSANCLDITQIPPTTTVEAIVEKIVDLVKQGKIKEISDIRDETGLSGLKITIDLKRGTEPDKLMQRLFKLTPLEDSFSCNFNVLVGGSPRVMGVRELLEEWTAFRIECVRRRTFYDLTKKKEKLHLLKGLQAILLDIDKAVAIVRKTEEEAEVVPNLMIGFGIDEVQAEYVAEIKLRHLNREYILKRTEEISQLEKEIANLQAILDSKSKVKNVIISELGEIARKYGQPRKTMIIYQNEIEEYSEEEDIPDYPVNLFFTKEGYFKKITPQSLRMSGEQKLKEDDEVTQHIEDTNTADLLFFTDRCQVYKAKASDFGDTKASVLGDYIPAKLAMDEGENAVYMAVTHEYNGYVLFFFENGKIAKVDMSAYATKTNRRKLLNAYSDKSPVVAIEYAEEDCEFLLTSLQGRILLVHSGAIQSKTTRSTQGVAAMTLRKGSRLLKAERYREDMLVNPNRYRKNIPAAGSLPAAEETAGEQLKL
ncbi:DNA gyrase/topoisomerase IV subunit A [Caproiciproducens galactitolivorans]|uniref:DNA topoisomerase (ATP-hydrolyzing) subunit A n=1 Tax=Caproiciproducens galactitolivorans TaxID=642589 RepID=A0ABT4BUH1_9FIRM|nr:DNA topoisomerase (ATP-hydrolyzing) subunit A [Caproiciproducens galactitolivorans]MCY1714524.1 DNA topoisomerase (ATP-hydrolyzing) subunit A [Caproiciproducens galactitolivorans]